MQDEEQFCLIRHSRGRDSKLAYEVNAGEGGKTLRVWTFLITLSPSVSFSSFRFFAQVASLELPWPWPGWLARMRAW